VYDRSNSSLVNVSIFEEPRRLSENRLFDQFHCCKSFVFNDPFLQKCILGQPPSAVVPHARICEGTVRATGGSTSIET